MPFLPKERREAVHRQGFAWTGADLNYLICYHVNKFLTQRAVTRELSYADFAEADAALTGAHREFGVVLRAYEETKIDQNGDVFSRDVLIPPPAF